MEQAEAGEIDANTTIPVIDCDTNTRLEQGESAADIEDNDDDTAKPQSVQEDENDSAEYDEQIMLTPLSSTLTSPVEAVRADQEMSAGNVTPNSSFSEAFGHGLKKPVSGQVLSDMYGAENIEPQMMMRMHPRPVNHDTPGQTLYDRMSGSLVSEVQMQHTMLSQPDNFHRQQQLHQQHQAWPVSTAPNMYLSAPYMNGGMQMHTIMEGDHPGFGADMYHHSQHRMMPIVAHGLPYINPHHHLAGDVDLSATRVLPVRTAAGHPHINMSRQNSHDLDSMHGGSYYHL